MVIKSEFPPVPVVREPFPKLFLDAIWKHFLHDPHRAAIINAKDPADRLTYGELYLYCHCVAAWLETRGFGHRDTCCLVLPNSWQFVSIFIGSALVGGTTSPASPIFTAYELERQFVDANCKIVFCTDGNFRQVMNAAKNNKRITTIVVMAEDRLKRLWLPNLVDGTHFDVVRFEDEVLRVQPNIFHRRHKVDYDVENDILLLPYSSGTTGSPKGVMISHRNFGSMINIYISHLKQNVYKAIDKDYDDYREHELVILPFYHIYGSGTFARLLISGTSLVFMRNFDPHLFCKTIETYKLRTLTIVPPLMVFLAKSPIVNQYDLSSLIYVFSGAAPAGRDLMSELKSRFPNLISVAQGYGMTELSLGCVFPVIDGKERFDSSGKLSPNFEMKIVDLKTGKECGPGERGELYFRSPTVMMGYLGKPSATAETVDKDGWLKSGDIGYIDHDGYIYIVDRLKELIKVKGFQVPPAELEDLLLSNPKIKDCAVIGVSDGKAGELPKAFVVKGDPSLTEQEVIKYVQDRVAHYKQLKGGVEFIDEIPKSAAGKILRRLLRDRQQKSQSSKL